MSATPKSDGMPSLGPLLVVVGLAVVAALGASLMLTFTAQRVAERNARAAVLADSLQREVAALRESLAVVRGARDTAAAGRP